ncbi:MAG: UDP-3-O-(3-hydroxymyristoyl)glucosamine N-acyltransferase [bacterium]|nr:UDP-3-O-(3-hydroxymyristoyl)glucosamine N-acyltransferase [bacterium]
MMKRLSELAEVVNGVVAGSDVAVGGVTAVENAEEGHLTWAENPGILDRAISSAASAVIAPAGSQVDGKPLLLVENPRLAFAKILKVFAWKDEAPAGIHPTAVVGDNFNAPGDVSIQANVYIGKNVTLGDKVVIYPGVHIGDNVKIGSYTIIYPNVTIYSQISIGKKVIIHAGAVIGSDGFGYVKSSNYHYKVPQIGTVIIEDYVEIGANVTIDRATTGATIIKDGTKIDNLVHIGHNVNVGEKSIVVAQVGISGSVKIGNRVILAGQVGVKDHTSIGADTIVGAHSGVISDLEEGSFVSGYPARPHHEQMRIQAYLRKLPEMAKALRKLQTRLDEITGKKEK